jgi:hypothetical protein
MTNDEGETLIGECDTLFDLEDTIKREMAEMTEFGRTCWRWWGSELACSIREVVSKAKQKGAQHAANFTLEIWNGKVAKSDPQFALAVGAVNFRENTKKYCTFFGWKEPMIGYDMREYAEISRMLMALIYCLDCAKNGR